MKSTRFLACFAPVFCALSAPLTHAADGNWNFNNTGTANWSDTTKWTGGTVADGAVATSANAVADFSTLDITATRTVTLDSNRAISSLKLDDTGATGDNGWTISGSSTLTLAGTGTPTIAVGSTGTANSFAGQTISTAIAGTQGFTMTGGNQLNLSGSLTGLSGAVTINGGRLSFGSNTSIGNITSVTVGSGGQIGIWNGGTYAQNFTLAGTGYGETNFEAALRVGDSGKNVTLNGTVTLSENATIGGRNGAGFANTFNGAIGETGGARSLTLGTVGLNNGTYVFTGANNYTGNTNVAYGTLNISGTGSINSGTTGNLSIGTAAGNNAVVNHSSSGTSSFKLINIGGSSTSAGALNISSGTVNFTNTSNSTYVEVGAGGYGSLSVSGGSLGTSAGNGMRVGDSNSSGIGVFNQSGGTVTLSRYLAIGVGGATGLVTLTGGTMNGSNGYSILIGNNSSSVGILNVGTMAGGNGLLVASYGAGGTANNGIVLGQSTTASGVLNLNSGTIQMNAGSITNGNSTGSSTVNLNGGTIKAGATGLTLLGATSGATSPFTVNVYNGGVTVDTNGLANSTISANLLATTGNGVYGSAGGLTGTSPITAGGAGYIGAPIVTVSGGSGSGITAVTMVSGGVVTGIQLTGPGKNYVAGDILTFTLAGGGSSTAATVSTYTLGAGDIAANSIGGLTKSSAGTLTLTGANTYTGTTTVSGGTLALSGGAAIADTGAVSLANTLGVALLLNASETIGSLAGGGASGGNVNLQGNALTVGNAASTTYAGILSGTSGALSKSGSGTLTLSGANTYTGNTTVTAGTLQFAKVASFYNSATSNVSGVNAAKLVVESGGTAALNVGGSGEFDPADVGTMLGASTASVGFKNGSKLGLDTTNAAGGNFAYGSAIANTNGGGNVLGLTKLGTGTLTLSDTNTYTGATSVSAGTLVINGDQTAATGNVSVSGAGTRLQGAGTVGGTTTINSGAIQSAGGAIANVDKVGKQIFDATGAATTSLTYGSGSIFEWDINANKATAAGTRGVDYDAVDVTGTLTVDPTAIFRVVLGSSVTAESFWQQTQTWTDIFGGGGSLSGLGFTNSLLQVVNTSGVAYNQNALNSGYGFSVSGTTLTWSAVPEPTSALAGLLIGAGLLSRRRKN
ncbi:MAG: autotransporter-associated beta strand repeat-containing protein [Luteolibacter sp.]